MRTGWFGYQSADSIFVGHARSMDAAVLVVLHRSMVCASNVMEVGDLHASNNFQQKVSK